MYTDLFSPFRQVQTVRLNHTFTDKHGNKSIIRDQCYIWLIPFSYNLALSSKCALSSISRSTRVKFSIFCAFLNLNSGRTYYFSISFPISSSPSSLATLNTHLSRCINFSILYFYSSTDVSISIDLHCSKSVQKNNCHLKMMWLDTENVNNVWL